MTITILINDTHFEVNHDRESVVYYRCECGHILKTENKLHGHTLTKTHNNAMGWRNNIGNTKVFYSLLTDKVIHRW